MLGLVLLGACSIISGEEEDLRPVILPPPGGGDLLISTPGLGNTQPGTATGVIGRGAGALAVYDFDVALDYQGQQITVDQTIEIVNPGPDFWDKVVFYMPWPLQTDRFALSRVRIVQQETIATTIETTEGGFLIVNLPAPISPNSSVTLNIRYGLDAEFTIPIARRPFGDAGYSEDIIQFTDWYPRLVPYVPGTGWYQWEPTLVGQPMHTDVADYNLRIEAPPDIIVASGGPLSRVNNTWEYQVKAARSIGFSASPDYIEVKDDTVPGVNIILYHLPQSDNSEQIEAVLTATRQALTLFNRIYGKYPYQTLVIAENIYTPTVANAGFLLHTGRGFDEFTGRSDTLQLLTVLLPYGLGQMYWQHFVGSNPVVEPWIGGGLTLYSEYLYQEAYDEVRERDFWEARVYYWNPRGNLNDTAYDVDNTEELLRNVYRNGALFMHELRGQMGDDAFFAFLQDYYRTGAFRNTNRSDVFELIGRHYSGNLSELVDKYFAAAEFVTVPTAIPTLTGVPTPGPSPSPTPQRIHVVQGQETVSELAWRYGITVRDIIEFNGLDPEAPIIFQGMELVIPYP